MSKMTKIPSCGVQLVRFNHKKLTELVLKDINCKDLQTLSTFYVIIEDKGHSLQQMTCIKDDFCNYSIINAMKSYSFGSKISSLKTP
ncbi:hypothetical protein Hanom_Chr04g00288711 [Helianthus anomalus]